MLTNKKPLGLKKIIVSCASYIATLWIMDLFDFANMTTPSDSFSESIYEFRVQSFLLLCPIQMNKKLSLLCTLKVFSSNQLLKSVIKIYSQQSDLQKHLKYFMLTRKLENSDVFFFQFSTKTGRNIQGDSEIQYGSHIININD